MLVNMSCSIKKGIPLPNLIILHVFKSLPSLLSEVWFAATDEYHSDFAWMRLCQMLGIEREFIQLFQFGRVIWTFDFNNNKQPLTRQRQKIKSSFKFGQIPLAPRSEE